MGSGPSFYKLFQTGPRPGHLPARSPLIIDCGHDIGQPNRCILQGIEQIEDLITADAILLRDAPHDVFNFIVRPRLPTNAEGTHHLACRLQAFHR